ncbi:hypothetical protein BV98_000007 [Sphingobium herbicidovorans NBRC 16415]|uniref:Uncharacterized protein n=2 Tax=Sphingobium herbicidovorans TaxID=76947 RepID=A0A086PEE2_SPHHM|nr:hypothetical protein [Sphingobium herbicidovorans]KFG91760.1 hypothetical protein BV98_000007 [Sphingobium herbicidovorans NBRC 16415]
MDRALKAVKAAGISNVRIVMDLNARTIEIIIGEDVATRPAPNPWDSLLSLPNEWDNE